MNNYRIKRYSINESEDMSIDIDEALLDELVELVGSEEIVEAAAEEAHEKLVAASDSGEIDMKEEDVPEKLAIAALMVTLVESGKLDPQEADDLIEKYLG